jgi:peptide deformylase
VAAVVAYHRAPPVTAVAGAAREGVTVALLELRIFGDPILRQKAHRVEDFDRRLVRLAEDMTETMLDAPGVGLAAPQVGVLKRLFTWQVDEEGGAVVNPTLTDADIDGEVEVDDEGCLSFPGLYYPVERPLRVEVTYQDLGGDEQRVQLEGFHARVWLHEMDHLNGILFIDHLAEHDRKEALRRMREYRIERGLDTPAPPPGPGGLLLGRRPR